MALCSLRPLCLLAAIAVALCILPAQAARNDFEDCCQSTRDTPLQARNANRFETYRIQKPQMGCSIPAIVLITKNGRGLCFPPESKSALTIKRVLDARVLRKQKQS